MILAEDEVGIGEDHDGIMVLDDALPVGAPLAEHLPIVDEVLELEITPNRPDCMAVYGVARDLHAVTAAPLAEDPTDARRRAVAATTAPRTTRASRSPTPRSACASPRACSRT